MTVSYELPDDFFEKFDDLDSNQASSTVIKPILQKRGTMEFVMRNWIDGINCPCCGQFVKLYKRKLNSQMGRFLIRIYNLTKQNSKTIFFDTRKITGGTAKSSSDGSYLTKWDLVQRDDHNRYAITQRGTDFVLNQSKEPKYLWIYNNDVYRVSDDTTTIRIAIGDKFNYDELMGK